jgi:hypothetical protein
VAFGFFFARPSLKQPPLNNPSYVTVGWAENCESVEVQAVKTKKIGKMVNHVNHVNIACNNTVHAI